MDKAELKRIAVEAATERIVGTSSVPLRYVATLVKTMSGFVDEFKSLKESVFSKDNEMERRIKKLDEALSSYYKELARLSKIQGEKGDTGNPGRDGANGRDGRDTKEIDVYALKNQILSLIRQPEDGKDALIDDDRLEEMLEKVLEKHKERLENEVSSYRNQLAGKVYGKDTWARGGGDTVAAGSNITITNVNGQKVISSTGGSSTALIPVGPVNAVNNVFDVISRPSSVISDGITYFEGAGYSYAALTITLDVPPSQYIRYYS